MPAAQGPSMPRGFGRSNRRSLYSGRSDPRFAGQSSRLATTDVRNFFFTTDEGKATMKEALHQAGLRNLMVTSALAIVIGTGWPPSAQATPITTQAVYYDTWGSVGSGSGPLTFIGLGSNATPGGLSFISPGSFLLGQFQMSSLPSSGTLNYNNTPFEVFANFSSSPSGPFSTVEISGTLNGTITGNSTSSMFATITSVQTQAGSILPPFLLSALSINLPQGIAPNGVNGGFTSLTAQLTVAADPPSPVPEPGSMAIFVAAIGGLGLWRYRRKVS